MKRLFYNIDRLFVLCVIAVMMLACNKTEGLQYSGETATIRLKIPQLETKSRVPVAGDEDAINNLRVIILSKNAGSINRLFTSAELPSSTDGGMITIENVPVGEAQMYVIANEGGLGLDYSYLATLQKQVITAPETGTRKVLFQDEHREYFPKRGSQFPPAGLPMSWMDKSLVIESPSETVQTIDVALLRAVAKLNIVMNNTTDGDIIIQEVNLGGFFANSLYLFRETNLDVPQNTGYVTWDFEDLAINVSAKSKETMVCYVYPSFAWKNIADSCPYEIGFKTSDASYEKRNFIQNGKELNSIERNKQININATLSEPANFKLTFSVEPWTPVTVNVPPFD